MTIMTLEKPIKNFLITVFSITYISWTIAAIISHTYVESELIFILHLIGGASPLIATIFYLIKTKEWKDFFNRLFNFHEISFAAWAITISPIIIIIFSNLIVFNSLNIDEEFKNLGMMYGFSLLFFGPIPEELGWRGILFNDLNKISFKKAQIYVMVVWLIWHLPLFFIVGTYQYNLGIVSLEFVFFCLNIILQSFIMGYLFMIGNKNIILPILFHYFVNLLGEMFNRNTVYEIVNIIFYGILLFFIILKYSLKVQKKSDHQHLI
ncbi:MAG: CPBP family intramembrane metalloprotease [Acholeplasmataceae bacterium]|nr:CPBP family intramembrane metalloprotease [Acholeplasmataceae bacterium]